MLSGVRLTDTQKKGESGNHSSKTLIQGTTLPPSLSLMQYKINEWKFSLHAGNPQLSDPCPRTPSISHVTVLLVPQGEVFCASTDLCT